MNQSVAPMLEALADYHARDRYGFSPPGTVRATAKTRGPSPRSATTRSARTCSPQPASTTPAPCAPALTTAGRRGLAEPSGRGRSPDRQPDTYSTCAEIKSIARHLPPAWEALIVDDAWVPIRPSIRTCRRGPWTPVLTCASSARTRWAPASSRDRSSTGRAALSIGPLVRLRRADYSVTRAVIAAVPPVAG